MSRAPVFIFFLTKPLPTAVEKREDGGAVMFPSPSRFSLSRLAPPLALIASASSIGLVACGGPAEPAQPPPAATATADSASAPSKPAKILSFDVAADSLRVDRVGMRDGELVPDGVKDLSFSAVVEGPITQLFLFQTDEKCSPSGSYRSDTLVGTQEAPPDLGGPLELGRLGLGMGVLENGKFINKETGAIPLISGERHTFRIYTGNTNSLMPGTHACLFGLQPDGVLVKSSPIAF
jgi:hypothetical protein